MISNDLREVLQPIRRFQIILWFALTNAIILYLVLAIFLSSGTLGGSPADPLLRNLFIFASVAIAIGSFIYWRHTHSDSYIKQILLREIGGEQLSAESRKWNVKAELDSKLMSLTTFDKQRFALVLALQIPLIINLALNESIAIFGLVGALLDKDFFFILPFVAAAIALNCVMFPRLDSLLERTERWRTG